MGFTYAPKRYHLTFTEGDLAGLEAEADGLSMRDLLRMDLLMDPGHKAATREEQGAETAEAMAIFARALVSWNLTDAAGEPAGTDEASVLAQDSGLVLRLMLKWWQELRAVPDPLPQASSNGASTELEASLPMVPSSPSQPN